MNSTNKAAFDKKAFEKKAFKFVPYVALLQYVFLLQGGLNKFLFLV